MRSRDLVRPLALIILTALPVAARGVAPGDAARPAPAAARASSVPRLYTAAGPTAAADLGRLRSAIGRLTGISKVEARPEYGAVTVTVEGDGRSTESLIGAAARSAGYRMRAVLPRYYSSRANGTADVARLRGALETLRGVEKVDVTPSEGGAAVRLIAVTPHVAVASAGASAGFTLHPLAAYVASGPAGVADLARLRAALGRVAGAERVETQGLKGGATLLVHGDAGEHALVEAARTAGFALWPLTNAPGPRLFSVEGPVTAGGQVKLRAALETLEGIGTLDFRSTAGGERLSITGGRVRPDAIVAAASEAGFRLASIEPPVALPTLEPVAGRSTPPDYDERVLEERANLGQPAPGFTVVEPEGNRKRSLAEYLSARKPVVLIFGSCSCPRFMAACPSLERLYREYGDRATFVLVYIAESHPGQILPFPNGSGGTELRVVPAISSEAESLSNLRELLRLANLSLPGVIESPAGAVNRDYAAYPNRIYVVAPDGKVVFKGEPGPTGFKVPDLEGWLRANVKSHSR